MLAHLRYALLNPALTQDRCDAQQHPREARSSGRSAAILAAGPPCSPAQACRPAAGRPVQAPRALGRHARSMQSLITQKPLKWFFVMRCWHIAQLATQASAEGAQRAGPQARRNGRQTRAGRCCARFMDLSRGSQCARCFAPSALRGPTALAFLRCVAPCVFDPSACGGAPLPQRGFHGAVLRSQPRS
jgi:hypothetical protein